MDREGGNRALIAMSGGVDSSVAAWCMKEAGASCVGITLKLFSAGEAAAASAGDACGGEGPPGGGFPSAGHPGAANNGPPGEGCRAAARPAAPARGCCSLADLNDARDVAYRLGMPHYVLNFTGEFREQVIRRFIETYEGGGTPNPCIDCNRYIKFNGLLLRARQLDFDVLVTGHYARIEKSGSRWLLKKAADLHKDQSYVLYCLSQEQLARTRFPLGGMTKPQVREIAGEQGFINAKKEDSQDICFVPDGDYGRFMEGYTGKQYPPGDILDEGGRIIGRHRGLVRYTIGQRRGLGVAAGAPLYVAAKDRGANTLTLARDAALYARSLFAGDLNLIACEALEKPLRLRVKTRYLQREQWALVEQLDRDRVRVDFDEAQRAISPGQAAVFYDGETVVGGGTITAACR